MSANPNQKHRERQYDMKLSPHNERLDFTTVHYFFSNISVREGCGWIRVLLTSFLSFFIFNSDAGFKLTHFITQNSC